MATTLQDVWESSRSNDWSYAYPFTVTAGVLLLTLVAITFRKTRRTVLLSICSIIMTYAALHASSLAITEKWRIRRAWANEHLEELMERERLATTVDGANLTLGPLLAGGKAGLLFSTVAIGVSVVCDWLRSDTDRPPRHSGRSPNS